jgi:hypothetical protein
VTLTVESLGSCGDATVALHGAIPRFWMPIFASRFAVGRVRESGAREGS